MVRLVLKAAVGVVIVICALMLVLSAVSYLSYWIGEII